MKNKTGFLFLFIVIFFASIFIYVQKSHRNINAEMPEFSITSKLLLNEFFINEIEASSKFLDKTILVNGQVTEINGNFLTLDDKIYCKFDTIISKSILNTNLKIKGRCIGYDDLLEQIKIDQCIIELK